MPSVCFGGEGGESAQRYFRASFPAQCLARRGWRTEVAELVLPPREVLELARDPRLRGGTPVRDHFTGQIVDIRIHEPTDIFTLRLMDDFDLLEPERRPDPEVMAESIRRAREGGQIVLVDLDDDVWNIPEWSPAARAMNRFNPKVRAVQTEVLDANIAAADGVMCTTRRIVEQAREHVPGCRAWLVPNGIDPLRWRWPRSFPDSGLKVGWMGSISHHAPHLRTMDSALDVLKDHDAEFVFLGRTEAMGREADELLASLPCRTSWRPWVDFGDLPDMLCDIDVGIIPRVDTPFNEGQSTTSGMEYAMAGVPFVAFASQPYRELAEEGCGLVARSTEEWRAQLDHLLAMSPGERRVTAAHNRDVVIRTHGAAPTAMLYDALFRALVEERR